MVDEDDVGFGTLQISLQLREVLGLDHLAALATCGASCKIMVCAWSAGIGCKAINAEVTSLDSLC